MGGPRMKDDGAQVLDVILGDLYAEERRDVLISMKLPEAASAGPAKLGNLCARGFSVLQTRFEGTAGVDLNVDRQFGGDAAGDMMTAGQRHEHVMRHHIRHIATKALEDGRAAARGGNLAQARRHLEAAS